MISIGIVKDDVVYLASNSTYYTLPSACYIDSNMPCFAIDKVPNAIATYSGFSLENQIFRYATKLIEPRKLEDGKLTRKHVVNITVKNMVDSLFKRNMYDKDETFGTLQGSLLLAKDDKLYVIGRDLDVRTIDSFIAEGENLNLEAMTYLENFKNEDVIYQIVKTYSILLSKSVIGSYPIIIRNTKEPKKPLVLSMEQAIEYIKNYEEKKGNKVCY